MSQRMLEARSCRVTISTERSRHSGHAGRTEHEHTQFGGVKMVEFSNRSAQELLPTATTTTHTHTHTQGDARGCSVVDVRGADWAWAHTFWCCKDGRVLKPLRPRVTAPSGLGYL